VHVRGPGGERAVPVGDFHLLPGDTPDRENVREPGDLITHVTLPPPVAASKQVYLKLRGRASYEFALPADAPLRPTDVVLGIERAPTLPQTGHERPPQDRSFVPASPLDGGRVQVGGQLPACAQRKRDSRCRKSLNRKQ
jgi:hypothetical protein